MAVNEKRQYLIAYDIADERRLQQVHRCVSAQALLVQYSVYLFYGTVKRLDRLLHELAALIDASEDDIRAYPIPRRAELILAGRSRDDQRLFLIGQGVGGFGPATAGQRE